MIQPPGLFMERAAVEAEYNRIAGLRDVLHVEAIMTFVAFHNHAPHFRHLMGGPQRQLDLKVLVCMACEAIDSLKRECQRRKVGFIGWDQLDFERRISLAADHPYNIMVPYLNVSGVESFGNYDTYDYHSERHTIADRASGKFQSADEDDEDGSESEIATSSGDEAAAVDQ